MAEAVVETNAKDVSSLEAPSKGNGEGRPKGKLDVLVQGAALFSDGYNIQIIGYMNSVLAKLYPAQMTTEVKTRLSNSILIGDVFGMIIFGLCIDRFGRRIGIILTTVFLVLGIILATAAHGATIEGMLWMMVIGRGVAGVGAGGEYTVCTSQAVECADSTPAMKKRRGMLVAVATNAAIISGFVASSIVSLIVLAAYGGEAHEGVWRICMGIGIVLPLFIFVFRMRLADSEQYKKHAIQHKVPYKLALKFYWKPLLGCCSAWFLYDFVVYPFNLLAPTLVAGIQGDTKSTLIQSIGWSALVNFFALPGAFIGALLMDRIGRRQTYALGWSIVCVFGFVIGGAMIQLNKIFPLFVVLYALFQTFLSVGPGDCNFLVSSESFPTPLRGHFLGFAAAVGKAGAAIGTTALSACLASYNGSVQGQQVVFLIGSAISVVGTLVVWFLIPNHPENLEDEDVRFRNYLELNGYDTSDMGLKTPVKTLS
ncbi:major facilitator superfamily domain-containing protein [Microdochium trichocladiopsis]|uniref:Major facilitator superfamily domain-containing protein n=1 Tax=Microdochium trichocladiopsis TaxID=1682393 RepID=A0A9P8Y1F5_9PEZI|nr:major facilitator superfamily domain-containing protein [Microdochium trichocladiopsis]KAH7025057.1 major facilitator superfamily domain-containing protein [Microdochium trichocladiopsis]